MTYQPQPPASVGVTSGTTRSVTVPTCRQLVPPARLLRSTLYRVRLTVTVPPGAAKLEGVTLALLP
jgi:hypothetical protein